MHSPRTLAAFLAAGIVAALVPLTASAQHHRGDVRRGGWDRGHVPYPAGPRYYYGGPRLYYAPYPIYIGPAYIPRYYAEPVYVERYYVEEAPPPPQRSFQERSYAQLQPPAAQPPRPAAPRLERYTLSATELFEFDKATLRKPQPKLDEIAAVLTHNPRIAEVRITGYTDRIGTEAYNLKLSQRRAEAVKAYLVAKGVEPRRLSAVGRGEAAPIVQCSDTNQAALIKCLEPNRRVEVEEITVEIRR